MLNDQHDPAKLEQVMENVGAAETPDEIEGLWYDWPTRPVIPAWVYC